MKNKGNSDLAWMGFMLCLGLGIGWLLKYAITDEPTSTLISGLLYSVGGLVGGIRFYPKSTN